MRSALICVFFTIIVHGRSQTAKDDFKPTPIPLNDWRHKPDIAGTLHETINSSPPAVVAAVPAHYWEDALRHSVYLTLVRDKIDQLIAKNIVVSPNNQPDVSVSKQVDDHDLWQKIKTAPFDRKKDEESPSFGDVTIVAKGRLLEDVGGFRFIEDDTSKDKCQDDKCNDGVKAFWSVKRVRQRDMEATPGKYHYELTFSVTQASKQQKKPYENPIRTFTVRESTPPNRNIQPEYQYDEPTHWTPRPPRAIWFHKNIAPVPRYQARQYNQGLDRLFSTLFDDEDTSYRHKPSSFVPHPIPQYSKPAHVGSSSEQHQQKRLMSYNSYKPQPYKYPRPLPAPPLPHYGDYDSFNPYTQGAGDQRYVQSSPMKTTRPAVLPTPPVSLPAQRNYTMEAATKLNITEPTTTPGVVTPPKTYNKAKPTPMKISYFNDHVRPPVFNAPPGVFVTMDKKPFKPMPPMKLIQSKPIRHKPSDFRPSPQVLDIQFSDPDPVNDNAFRPITVNYHDDNTNETTTDNISKIKNTRRKPPKKHGNIKSHQSTVSPDIITAGSDTLEEDTLQWANVVGAFAKTTPMVSLREKVNVTESIAVVTTTDSPTTVSSTTESTTRVVEASSTTSTTTTTLKPKKRTRPPPKFKTEKKKHKRVSSTTTKAPEEIITKRTTQDLTPQASSSISGNKNKITSTTPMVTTTTVTTTTTVKPSTVVVETNSNEEEKVSTTPSKTINRFRQSTLMHKGTSVNHDKWGASNVDRSKYVSSNKNPSRRKGSNFQGYLPSSTPRSVDKERKRDHEDMASSTYATTSNDETNNYVEVSETEITSPLTISTVEGTPNHNNKSIADNMSDEGSYYTNNPEDYEDEDDDENKEKHKDSDDSYENDEQEVKDHSEYIFHAGTTATTNDKIEINEIEKPLATQMPVVISTISVAKNKTKCKKKKLQNLTSSEQAVKESKQLDIALTNPPTSTSTTTEITTTSESDIFEELFGGFSENEAEETPKEHEPTKPEPIEGESAKNEQYAEIDKELEDFLDSLDKKNHSEDNNESEEYEDDREFSSEEEDTPFNYDDDIRSRHTDDDLEDEYHNRPYSLLELMAME